MHAALRFHTLTAVPWVEQDDHLLVNSEAVLSPTCLIHSLCNHLILSYGSIHWDLHPSVHSPAPGPLHGPLPLPLTDSSTAHYTLKASATLKAC